MPQDAPVNARTTPSTAEMPFLIAFPRVDAYQCGRCGKSIEVPRFAVLAGGADAVLERLFIALPDDPVAQSLWARRLLMHGQTARALPLLDQVATRSLVALPYTARESARQVMWRYAIDAEVPQVALLTRLIAEASVPPSLVAEWERREGLRLPRVHMPRSLPAGSVSQSKSGK